jgi:hypothetical protein
MQTVNNVMGDAYGAGLINHLSTDLHELPDDEANGGIKNGHVNGHTGGNDITKTTNF